MPSDKEILQPLVEQIIAWSSQPIQDQKKRMWADHQALRRGGAGTGRGQGQRGQQGQQRQPKIPVCVYYEGIPEPTWQEILGPDSLRCVDPLARGIERDLRRRLYIAANVPDDHIVWPAAFVPAVVTQPVSWGVPLERKRPGDGSALGAYAYTAPLGGTAGIDLGRVKFTDQIVDPAATDRDVQRANELLTCPAGRLTVYVRYPDLGYCPFDLLVEMRGLEQVMMDAVERPEELAALMEAITAGYQQHHENRQRLGHINRHVSADGQWQMWGHRVHCYYPASDSGTPNSEFGIRNSESKKTGNRSGPKIPHSAFRIPNSPPSLADEWAYVSAQTSSGFGPGLFSQLVHPYNVRLAGYFTNQTVYFHGCETLDRKLDALATLPNLRRFHVSPWSSVPAAVAKFDGRVVLEVHAHPGKVLLGGTADSIRAELRELIAQADGSPIDLNLSDIHSVDHRPETLGLWARIAQELVGV